MSVEPTDADRYPTLSAHGRQMLDYLREHPAAPIYRNTSGNRLTADDVASLRAFEGDVIDAAIGWRLGSQPDWLDAFVAATFADVPYFRGLGSPPRRFEDLPTVRRADLATDIARFVPDAVDVDRLINFRTTGTSGSPLLVASHPRVAGCYLAFHKRALRRLGIELTHGRGQVGVVLIGFQRKCFTYVSVNPTMDESGLAKINLHPHDWHDPLDRARYLEALSPEVIAGDPISFAELMALAPAVRPKAMLSVSMMLSSALRSELEHAFGCPVLDLYSLNEAGPVAVWDAAHQGHLLLQPMMYVEILDERGVPVAPGDSGEVTLTGGFNPCLPLLRYRTGDHAALADTAEGPMLVELHGRAPVRFRTAAGDWVNNIDVTHALADLPIPQFALHQDTSGGLGLQLAPSAMSLGDAARSALMSLLGPLRIDVAAITQDDKVIQYTSDLDPLAK